MIKSLPVYILAGGWSRRFGEDKARTQVQGRPMLDLAARAMRPLASTLTVVARTAGEYDDLGLHTIGDRMPGRGPLGGLLTALEDLGQQDEEWMLLTACDLLGLQASWLNPLLSRTGESCRAAAFRAADSQNNQRWQPLPALFHRDALAVVQDNVEQGRLALWRTLGDLHGLALPLPPQWERVVQVNAPEDLHAYCSMADSGTYVLWITLDAPACFTAGALGQLSLEPGTYLYVGSARQGLAARVGRHLRRTHGAPQDIALSPELAALPPPSGPKRPRWHIDYLLELPGAVMQDITLLQGQYCECGLVRRLRDSAIAGVPLKGFGASDCGSGCGAHLLLLASSKKEQALQLIKED